MTEWHLAHVTPYCRAKSGIAWAGLGSQRPGSRSALAVRTTCFGMPNSFIRPCLLGEPNSSPAACRPARCGCIGSRKAALHPGLYLVIHSALASVIQYAIMGAN